MSTTDRIEKLIALSGSANEHEARSAAYLACKLIREGGFRVVASAPAAEAWFDDFPTSAWTTAPRPPPQRPAPDTRPRRVVESEIGTARRSGRCAVCDEVYEEGSDVAHPTLASDRFLGAVHADCRARWRVLVET